MGITRTMSGAERNGPVHHEVHACKCNLSQPPCACRYDLTLVSWCVCGSASHVDMA